MEEQGPDQPLSEIMRAILSSGGRVTIPDKLGIHYDTDTNTLTIGSRLATPTARETGRILTIVEAAGYEHEEAGRGQGEGMNAYWYFITYKIRRKPL